MKKFLKSPWAIALVPPLIIFLLTIIYDFAKGKKILSSVCDILISILNYFTKALNFNVKVWWLLLGLFIIFLAIYIHTKITPVKSIPEFLTYTTDNILDWSWKWEWHENSYGKYEIANLHPVCPLCNTPLVDANTYNDLYCCLRCKYTSKTQRPLLSNVGVLIIDNVKRNSYTNAGDNI